MRNQSLSSQRVQGVQGLLSRSRGLRVLLWSRYNHPALVVLCCPPDQGDPAEWGRGGWTLPEQELVAVIMCLNIQTSHESDFSQKYYENETVWTQRLRVQDTHPNPLTLNLDPDPEQQDDLISFIDLRFCICDSLTGVTHRRRNPATFNLTYLV